MGLGQGDVFAKHIAALAYRTHDIIYCLCAAHGGCEVLDGVARAVHGRTNELGETGIDDEEVFGVAVFDVEGARDEGATLCHNRASQLKM